MNIKKLKTTVLKLMIAIGAVALILGVARLGIFLEVSSVKVLSTTNKLVSLNLDRQYVADKMFGEERKKALTENNIKRSEIDKCNDFVIRSFGRLNIIFKMLVIPIAFVLLIFSGVLALFIDFLLFIIAFDAVFYKKYRKIKKKRELDILKRKLERKKRAEYIESLGDTSWVKKYE